MKPREGAIYPFPRAGQELCIVSPEFQGESYPFPRAGQELCIVSPELAVPACRSGVMYCVPRIPDLPTVAVMCQRRIVILP